MWQQDSTQCQRSVCCWPYSSYFLFRRKKLQQWKNCFLGKWEKTWIQRQWTGHPMKHEIYQKICTHTCKRVQNLTFFSLDKYEPDNKPAAQNWETILETNKMWKKAMRSPKSKQKSSACLDKYFPLKHNAKPINVIHTSNRCPERTSKMLYTWLHYDLPKFWVSGDMLLFLLVFKLHIYIHILPHQPNHWGCKIGQLLALFVGFGIRNSPMNN